jgi:Protein of unknown function (DUF1553)/Protein of unknown function (DUF1549)/Planctomycete cytochrome C
MKFPSLFLPLPALALLSLSGATAVPAVDFNREVRPILSDRCYPCHGFDRNKRKAGLRLDTREGALAGGKSGHAALVPGKPEESSIVARIRQADPEEVMPPPESHKPLAAAEKDLLARWIAGGAPYADHWSYTPVARPTVPAVKVRGGNPVDAFLRDRLAREGLAPAPEADRRTLVRRLAFDLHGMPPEPGVAEAFAASKDPKSWEKLVDAFLASPRFAERQTLLWLDLVRYADSIGFHGDCTVSVWPYRDYVLRAFQENRPFDRFTREQLAGDLLPDATEETRVASGYNRLNRMSTEGGVQDKEYLAKYAADRVRTTSITWLGTTMGCAECHDHKFDPVSTRDFYSFAAFFADIQEQGFYDRGFGDNEWGPKLRLPTADQKARLGELDAAIARQKAVLEAASDDSLNAAWVEWEAGILAAQKAGRLAWTVQKPVAVSTRNGAELTVQGDWVRAGGANPDTETYVVRFRPGAGRWTALRLQTGTDDELAGNRIARNGTTFHISGVDLELRDPAGDRVVDLARVQVTAASEGTPGLAMIDGDPTTSWSVGEGHSRDHHAVFQFGTALQTTAESELVFRIIQESPFPRTTVGRFAVALTTMASPTWHGATLPDDVWKSVEASAGSRKPESIDRVRRHFRTVAPQLQDAQAELERLEAKRSLLLGKIPSTLVSEARPEPRVMRILARGNWMDESGPVVVPALPGRFSEASGTNRLTRLDLARWITSPSNPLTARVFVNRQWKMLFGAGLSRVLDDVGSQGEWPSHPELLDWLAAEFMSPTAAPGASGPAAHAWDVKHLVRVIATSAAYRQSSVGSPAALEKDPYNRLVGRQGRFRIEAEAVRDTALAVSGLLVERAGGPSVRPPQPEGYWAALNFPKREYVPGVGEELYRRSLYTHWQRTFLHPALAAFDAPSREECTANRVNSNTPLQALVLLNDATYAEAARVLAAEALHRGGKAPDAAIAWAWNRALARPPRPAELVVLRDLRAQQLERYRTAPAEAAELLSIGAAPLSKDLPPAELAAMTAVTRAILNLHETITRN